ncbi:MAG: aldehyde dehydrogenase family protein [Deltaproteobacteria bacterium]|nr:aldehyde dehydrogenase family protein [Deltaproteobacteria bacterium]MCB9788692.1 aldehyde dehydrogenase family protein [Deltaproteobacteria bacterium]
MAKAPERITVRKTYKLFIGGAFPRSESGRYTVARDDKGAPVANVCRASRKDLRDAVVAARKAQEGWAKRTAFNRGQILYRMAEMLESRSAVFEAALTAATGLSAKAAEGEVGAAVDRLVWYAGWADKFPQFMGTTNPVASAHFNFTFPEATGVVVAFASEGSALLGLVSAIAPVIVSGNSVVVVVSGPAPTVAMELAEVLATSDLPGGVVNILTGLRDELAPHAARHMDVDGILCVGADDATRKLIGVEAAESVKRVHFEDDGDLSHWHDEARQSPYLIVPFVELKTAWHPMGM